MCVSQQELPFLGACWADGKVLKKFLGCMLCLISNQQRFVLLVLVDVIYLSFFQFFCQ